jgi:hypothetical protein
MQQIKQSLETIAEVCQIFGFQGSSIISISNTTDHYLTLSQSWGCDWIKVLKYKTSAFFAHHNDQQLPVCPGDSSIDKPEVILGGEVGRWIKVYMYQSTATEKLEFTTSILQSKKGMPRPSDNDLQAAVEKTEKVLTTKNPGKEVQRKGSALISWADSEKLHPKIDFFLHRENVKVQLRRTVRELFKKTDKPFTAADRVKSFFPSTSANYIKSRSGLGCIGTIFDHPKIMEGLRVPGGYLKESTRIGDPCATCEQLNNERDERITEEEKNPFPDYNIDTKRLDDAFQTLWLRMLKAAVDEEGDRDVTLVPLPEPLKVRVISKGPPFTYAVLRALWKHCHNKLRHHPTFKLIGEPISEENLTKALGKDLKEDECFLSGDYEGATDNLKSWVSETIAEEISTILELHPVERRLFIGSLTKHTINGKKQEEGQLMGSITSFPILNIANAAMCRWAIELAENQPRYLSQCRMLINGDDVGIKSKQHVYSFWRKITEFAGLKESIGKTFISRKFININSTNFVYSEEEKTFTLTRYVNMGLMKGLKRSGGRIGMDDLDDQYSNLSVRCKKVIELAPERLQKDVYKSFIQAHLTLLKKTRLPWFMPTWIGGIGLPITAENQPSELDRRVASHILFNWKKIRPIALSQEQPWRMRKLADKGIVSIDVATKGQGTKNYEELIQSRVINLLFDSHIRITDLHEEIEGGKVSRALKHNTKVWKVPKGSLPPPILLENLKFAGKYPAINLQKNKNVRYADEPTDPTEETNNEKPDNHVYELD